MEHENGYVAMCPACKTFETLWFVGSRLVPARKFAQGNDGHVYHDCGTKEPCRLLPGLVVGMESQTDLDEGVTDG